MPLVCDNKVEFLHQSLGLFHLICCGGVGLQHVNFSWGWRYLRPEDIFFRWGWGLFFQIFKHHYTVNNPTVGGKVVGGGGGPPANKNFFLAGGGGCFAGAVTPPPHNILNGTALRGSENFSTRREGGANKI